MAEQPDDPRPAAPLDWRSLGACRNLGPDRFFVDDDEADEADEESFMAQVNAAKAVCNGTTSRQPCPVRVECLAYALENTIKYGVWGGWGEYERKRMRMAAGSGRAAAQRLREAERDDEVETG